MKTNIGTPPEQPAEGEKKHLFSEMPNDWQQTVIISHAKGFGFRNNSKRYNTLERIFGIANPYIITGNFVTKQSYCRIASESKNLVVVLIKNYL